MVCVTGRSFHRHRDVGQCFIAKDHRNASGACDAGGSCCCSPQQSPRVGRQTNGETRCQRGRRTSTRHGTDGPTVEFARVGVDDLGSMDDASTCLLVEGSGEDRPTLFASEGACSVNDGLGRNDTPHGCLLVIDERTADGRTITRQAVCRERPPTGGQIGPSHPRQRPGQREGICAGGGSRRGRSQGARRGGG